MTLLSLLQRRGELAAEILEIDRKIADLHPDGVKLCAVCFDPISVDRLRAQPRAVVCGKQECKDTHYRRVRRDNSREARKRAKQARQA